MGRCAAIALTSFWFEAAAALACGFLSGLGVGGGSLLMVWMTGVLSMEQTAAQGINLLYYLPTAGIALLLHTKNKLVDWRCAVPALLCGCVAAAGGALLAGVLDASVLRRLYGIVLLAVGVRELFAKR